MPGPFDFLGNIGNSISGAEKNVQNTVGGWLKGLLPSQPAQPQNPPLTSPSPSTSPLAGMRPGGGVGVSGGGRVAYSNPAMNQQSSFGQNVMNQQLGGLGGEFMKQFLPGSPNLTDPNNPVNKIRNTLAGARGSEADFVQGKLDQTPLKNTSVPSAVGNVLKFDPFDWASKVINAGVVQPAQLAADPQYWLAEDGTNPGKLGAFDPTGMISTIGPESGRNFLRDALAPAVKAVTGEDVPHTRFYYQNQTKALLDEQQRLLAAQNQLEPKIADGSASQAEIDAYNAKYHEYNTKFQNLQKDSIQSANWWQNSNVAKAMSIMGSIATFPEGMAAGTLAFAPQLLSDPLGTGQSMISQVAQAVKFVQDLQDQSKRDNMSAQDLASNISNIAMIGAMLAGGAKTAGHGLDAVTRDDTIKALQEHNPELANPSDGAVATAHELTKARADAPPTAVPQEDQIRVADLQSSLTEAQRQLQTEVDPVMKRTLIERAAALRDEINNIESQPKRAAPTMTPQELATRQVRQDIGDERNLEAPPAFTKPVEPATAYPDYFAPSTKVLGPNYQFLEPRPQDFSVNTAAEQGRFLDTAHDFATATPTEIRAKLLDSTFIPSKISKLGGNGWISPDGLAIDVRSADQGAHQEFFTELGVNEDNAPQIFMDRGWVKKSSQAGAVGFGVRGANPRTVDLINQAIIADSRKGIPPLGYWVADELTGRPPVEISPQEFAANNFDVGPILAAAERRSGLITYARPSAVDIENITLPEQTQNINAAAKTLGLKIEPDASRVMYGFVLPDGRGMHIDPMHQNSTHFGFYSRYMSHLLGASSYTDADFEKAIKGFVEVRQEGAFSGRLNLYAHDSLGKKHAENYLLQRADRKPSLIFFEWVFSDFDNKYWSQVATFSYNDFASLGFQLNNKLFRTSKGSEPIELVSFDEGQGDPYNHLLHTQGEQIVTQSIGETGQTGTPSTTSRPKGSPEGTTLTSIVPALAEGQSPVAFWKVNPEPAGSIPGGSRAAQLATKQDLKNSIIDAINTTAQSQGLKDAHILDTIIGEIQAEIEKIPPQEIAKIVERRKQELINTFVKVRGKYDPLGYVLHFIEDPATKSDAYFNTRIYRAITFNPIKSLTPRWANIMGIKFYNVLDRIKEELPPESYVQARDFLQQWIDATQDQLDENIIAEELFHAYDVDHVTSVYNYLKELFYNTTYEWRKATYDAGLGDGPTGFGDSVWGLLQEYINNPRGNEKLGNWLFEKFSEYRASSFKVAKGTPLAGYTYRVPEVFKHEIKDPTLIKKPAQEVLKDFEARVIPNLRRVLDTQTPRGGEVSTAIPQQGRFEQAMGSAGVPAGTNAIGAADSIPATWLGGPTSADQAGLTAPTKETYRQDILTPEQKKLMATTMTTQALTDLHSAGWSDMARWEQFARNLLADPNSKEFKDANAMLDKMPPKSQEVFLKAAKALGEKTVENIKRGADPVPAIEALPEVPAPPTREEIRASGFQAFQKEIAEAQAKIEAAGPRIAKMYADGTSQKDINAERAGLAGLRAYVDALKNGETIKRAIALGRDAKVRETERLRLSDKTTSPVPELEEEPFQGVFLGKRYAAVNPEVARRLAQRLQWLGYNVPIDPKGNAGVATFFDGLFAEERSAEEAYKKLPSALKDYLKQTIDYRGVPFRGKGKQGVKPATPEIGVAPGTEDYINQTDFEGLEKAIAVVPQKGGFISIRHGSTARNGGAGGEEKLRGQDDVLLNEQGQKHAERLAAAFKGMNISAIYTSPMKRAVDTANAIAAETGAKVFIDQNLRPQDIGDYAGKSAKIYGKILAEQAVNNPEEKAPNGESRNDYLRRFLPAIRKHMADALTLDGITLEINHTTGIRTIKGHIMAGSTGLDVHPGPILDKEEIGPGGIMGMKFEDGRWQIAGDYLTNRFTGEKEYVNGEASQKFEVPKGEKAVAPRAEVKTEDPIVTGVKEQVKDIKKAERKAAKIKGELPPNIDLATKVDEIAADPSHPANASAVQAKVARDLLPKAEQLGGSVYEQAKATYALALQRLSSRLAVVAKEKAKNAKSVAPVVADQKLFDHTAAIAEQLQRKIDKGEDPGKVAAEAAKKIGMSLKDATIELHDSNWKLGKAGSWAPAYRDLILGKVSQTIRSERLAEKKIQRQIPFDADSLINTKGRNVPSKSSSSSISTPERTHEMVTPPAVAKVLERGLAKSPTDREVSGDKIVKDVREKVQTERARSAKKSTKTLRDETQEIHKLINTPSPNPFTSGFQAAVEGLKGKGHDIVAWRKERRKAGLEEPGMKNGSGDSGDEPPDTPGELLAGWDDPRDHLRSFGGDWEKLALRWDDLVKSLAQSTDPGRNTAHHLEQAHSYLDRSQGDLFRASGVGEIMEKLIGNDLDLHRQLTKAIEGSEEERAQARGTLTPEQAAFVDLWRAHETVAGRIKVNKDLMKAAIEDHLAHIVKFDENGLEVLDKQGNVRSSGISGGMRWWVNRLVDDETGEAKYPTIKSLVDEFKANNVEENLNKIFKSSTQSFIKRMRYHELIEDLKGHFINNLETMGLKAPKGVPPYEGYAIVTHEQALKMDDRYRNQLDTVNMGPAKGPLTGLLVYKPLKELLERLADTEENPLMKANSIYKLYKFGFNPIHAFNLYTNMDSIAGRGITKGLPDPALYNKTIGRINKHLNGNEVWNTPIGQLRAYTAIARLIDAGATVRERLIDTAGLGQFQALFAKYPAMKQWHNFMWYELAWKGQLGLAMHLTDDFAARFEAWKGRPMNEPEFNNAMRLAVLQAKYTMGFIDRTDMTRQWNVIAGTGFFANSWTTVQMRFLGKALPKWVPGSKFLANVGGGERYIDIISPAMKAGGMEPETLRWINSQEGHLARQFVLGGTVKLLAVSVALGYIGSTISVMTGQPGAQASGPWQNFLKDPTHTFDIYGGVDSATGKYIWHHNPLYGMMQEVINDGMEAVRAQRRGESPALVATAPLARFGFGKTNPILSTILDVLTQRENSLYYQGYGDKRSGIQGDPSIVAIQQALSAKGINLPVGIEDSIIYAIRQLAPSPGFAPNIQKGTNISTPGDILNALGPGKILGIGDFMNSLDSSSPDFGNFDRLFKYDLGNAAQYLSGSRTTLSSTPAQIATDNQIAADSATNQQKQQMEQQMAQAMYKGDFKTVLNIANQLNMDNAQMLNALEHPPAGSGGGIIYHGLPYQSSTSSPTQDTLMGYTLSPSQTTDLEGMKKLNTMAAYNQIITSTEWQNGDKSTRANLLSGIETNVNRAVEMQWEQKNGWIGGTPISNNDIQNLIDSQLELRNQAMGTIVTSDSYIASDSVARARMVNEYKTFADTLAWDATFGKLQGVPPERIQTILDATIQTEEGARYYLRGSLFYQMADPNEQTRMLKEYSSLARTIAKRYALDQGQGTRGDIQLPGQDLLPAIKRTIDIEETAKALLHGTDYYNTSDNATQNSLDSKYETLARTLAFTPAPIGDPSEIINQSILAEQSYFDLQNQFGGGNYIKLMAQQLSDLELTFRQGSDYTPKQIAKMQKAIRANFLVQNPSYAQYLKAKTWWGRHTTDGQIYNALGNSEYAAIDDLAQADVSAPDSVLISGTSSDTTTPYFDPASNMGLTSQSLGSVDLNSNPVTG